MKILIVGAASGIGFEVARELARKNHNVYIGVHHEQEKITTLEKIKNENIKIKVYKIDVKNKKDIKIIKFIDPDCIMIHAGIGNGGTILDMDINVLKENYETNIFANFELLQEFYHLKISNQAPGKIFITSSIAAYLPIPFLGSYTSSKAAISMLCKTLRYELKYINKNISITLIEPGAYHTGFNQVMIDNKDLFLNHNSKIYKNSITINRLQRNLFRLIEKDNTSDLVKKVVKEMEKVKPKFRIRRPIIQSVFLKLYLIFFG